MAAPTTYDDLFGLMLGALPSGHRYVVDTFWSDAPLPEVLEGLPAHYEGARSDLSTTVVTRWSLSPPADTAFSLVGGTLTLHYTIWDGSEADAENMAWHDRTAELFAPHAVGHYIAETDIARHPERAEQSYSREAWLRLRKLRAAHDPDGLFIDHFARPVVL